MPNWRAEVRRRIKALGLEPTREAELAEELGQHLDDRYQELLGRGLSADAAKAQVISEQLDDSALRQALGAGESAPAPAPPVLGAGRSGWFSGLGSDLWFAVRSLWRHPGMAAVVWLTLAIGIGANVAVFSVVNALLLRPLPFKDPARLVAFWGTAPEMRLPVVNYPDALYHYYRRRLRTLDPFAFYGPGGMTLASAETSERINVASVSQDFFRVLGATPLYGRTFLPEESVPNGTMVVVLSHRLWQRRFGSDPAVLGRSIRLNEAPATVVGVMEAGFDFPSRAEVWMPQTIDASSVDCWCSDAIGRLAAGRVADDVVKEIESLNADFWAEREGRPRAPRAAPGTVVAPLARVMAGELRTPVLVLLGAVVMVMLIACANLAGLFLVRAVAQSREIAVRTALGASPARIVRQILAETGILVLAGAAAGLLIGWVGIQLVERSLVDRVHILQGIPLDLRVVAFAAVTALITVVVFGAGPAIQSARVALAPALKEGSRATEDRSQRRASRGFVVAQLALSVVLLAGAGLLLRSFQKLTAVDLGFEAKQVVVARFAVPWNSYQQMPRVRQLAAAFLERARAVPGVLSAGLTSTAPFSSGNNQQELTVEGQEPAAGEPSTVASVRRVSVGYFETVATPLLEGRYLQESDRDGSEQVVIVDETIAQRYWPGQSALGKRINTNGAEGAVWRTVVGVVASIHHQDLSKAPDHYVYQPLQQGLAWNLDVVVRTAAATAEIEAGLRRSMAATDPGIPLFDVHSLDAAVDRSLEARRVTQGLLAAFAAAALVLAAIGIYGVMSRAVLARTREFGVRLALGATPATLARTVLREGAALVGLGLALGLLGAAGLSRYLESMLFEVEPIDPITFGAIPLLLAVAAGAAVYWPVRRATAVDPLEAMRAD